MTNQATLGTGRVGSAARRSRASGEVKTKPANHPTEDAIRQRAYEIFLARGQQGGTPLEDWLQAERELRSPSARRRTPPRQS